jgi:hypothetical protein
MPAILIGLTLLTAVLCPSAADAEKLDRQLLKSAPSILEKLRRLGYRSVGVLKFRVQVDPEPIKDNVGTLNYLIADRLETALALANSPEPAPQLRLARRASEVAAEMPSRPNHLQHGGREALLAAPYQPAWGSGPIQVDALLTGIVSVASNLRTMHVAILMFGNRQAGLSMVEEMVAETDGLILNELGRSYHKRGLPNEDLPGAAKRVDESPQEAFPLREKQAVVQLRIFYDDQPVELELRDHMALIPEPRQGQRVTMLLERTDQGPQRLAAVLKVNGENTLYRERGPDVDCSKWVLEAGAKRQPIQILGFQRPNNREAEQFRVLSRADSRPGEMCYGPEVGTISLTLFAEHQPSAAAAEEDADLLAVAKACFPDKPAKDAAELQAQIRRLATAEAARPSRTTPVPVAPAKPKKRGLIVSGEAIKRATTVVEFVSAPEPFFSVVIRYYRPQSALGPVQR